MPEASPWKISICTVRITQYTFPLPPIKKKISKLPPFSLHTPSPNISSPASFSFLLPTRLLFGTAPFPLSLLSVFSPAPLPSPSLPSFIFSSAQSPSPFPLSDMPPISRLFPSMSPPPSPTPSLPALFQPRLLPIPWHRRPLGIVRPNGAEAKWRPFVRSCLAEQRAYVRPLRSVWPIRPNIMAFIRPNGTEQRPFVWFCLAERCRKASVPRNEEETEARGLGEGWCREVGGVRKGKET